VTDVLGRPAVVLDSAGKVASYADVRADGDMNRVPGARGGHDGTLRRECPDDGQHGESDAIAAGQQFVWRATSTIQIFSSMPP
jgi:hypothetical protein